MKKDLSYKTAITRNKMSTPLKCLLEDGLIDVGDKIIDFGCGRGDDLRHMLAKGYDICGYDPHYMPIEECLNRRYDIILCTYVLNVISKKKRQKVIKQLKSLKKEFGKIYLTVRRDIKEDYTTKLGTEQYLVKLPYNVLKETRDFCIYEI